MSIPERIDEFRLLEMLGRGSMGLVYRARDTMLKRDVAIKLMNRPSPVGLERFFIEALCANIRETSGES